MVVADCESELVRDGSRGLEGGAFFAATLLNRKEAKAGRGKDSIDALKDLILLKGDARFCQYFLMKFGLDPEEDQTPPEIKSTGPENKESFMHQKVELALKDLLPYFSTCNLHEDPDLSDHPLQEGRRPRYSAARENVNVRKESPMNVPTLIEEEIVEKTVLQVHDNLPHDDLVDKNMEKVTENVSGTRQRIIYRCKICSFQSKYKTVCRTHVITCMDPRAGPETIDTTDDDDAMMNSNAETALDCAQSEEKKDDINDQFWNYKNSEFFIDAIFGVTSSFERFGDGLGCFIVNKILLPVFHGLRHSNYSSSVHRFITRVLCEATPKEGLKLIYERFSNRLGGAGNNVNRDRRMEYRIGTEKKLISNLGPNFSKDSVQKVNATVDIKEELFLKARECHGVKIRSGNHNARSDTKDYDMLFSQLTNLEAHRKINGRTFGNYNLPENLMEDDKFSKAEFYRWLVAKNKEAKAVLDAKRKTT